MNVCLLAPAYHPFIGGAESYARMVAEGLAERGHSVTVITDGSRVDVPDSEGERNITILRLREFAASIGDRTKLPWEQMVFSLLDEVERRTDPEWCPDVVFTNSLDTAVLGAPLAISWGVPLVATYHEQFPEIGRFGPGRCRLVFEHLPLSRLIVGSDYYREKALRYGANEERLHRIYHGIDTELFAPVTNGYSNSQEGPVVLCAGRLAPRKGQLLLVEAFEHVLRERPDARLSLVGTAHSSVEDYVSQLHAAIARLPDPRAVSMDGTRTLADMPNVYRGADIVVVPSSAEGLGLAAIEAMACAKPVVASDIPGLQEVMTESCGVSVPAGSAIDLAGAIVDLLSDEPRRRALAVAGRKRVVEVFSRERMFDELELLLNQVTGS